MDSFFRLEQLLAKMATHLENGNTDYNPFQVNQENEMDCEKNSTQNQLETDNQKTLDNFKVPKEPQQVPSPSKHCLSPVTNSANEDDEPCLKKSKMDDSFTPATGDERDDEEYEIYNGNYSNNDNLTLIDDFRQENGQNADNAYEFDILDEFENAPDDDSFDKNDGDDYQSDSDVPVDEIEAMLEEGYSKSRKTKNDELAHEEKQKIVLKARGHDHFDVLPEGWIVVTHNSGMPVYLQKQTRVCTMAKPYFLGSGSARKHEIPISAIPCFQYRKELDKEKGLVGKLTTIEEEVEQKHATADTEDGPSSVLETSVEMGDEDEDPSTPLQSSESDMANNSTKKQSLPPAKVESVQDSQKEHSLEPLAVRKYCQQLFEFQAITVRRFKTWAGRRKHQKMMKQSQRPSLPESTKLITCPLPPTPDQPQIGVPAGNGAKREFIMNPCGKSYVCILHEYVQHAMRMQPRYVFKELENASTPYGATVVINDMEYGSGLGSSKKQAKSEAARVSLEILIPQLKQNEKSANKPGQETHQQQQQDVAFFDEVGVEDNRVSELCLKAGQPSPYQILLECLKRNYGMGDTQIKFEMNNLKHQKNEFKMAVGKHTATVICKNKRDGKQRASQSILQKLHPHIRAWGSLLRLYGKGSCKTLKEKKEEEQRITELQSKACANRPNNSILNKLKEEMLKLRETRQAIRSIGKFIPEEMDLPSSSSSNLKNVEL